MDPPGAHSAFPGALARAQAADLLTPRVGEPPFGAPSFDPPSNGATVGVAKPILIKFQSPVTYGVLAESALTGRFYSFVLGTA
ncbi:conserved hypothetical protein [uncultured Mycobacterium sp.]|uniref:Uncharacterized protein n=1 Tax=uncultured Mycobacterium sp. TaxID=171292 RepID=A0A1Y5PFQ5_9MYCO|nr:conserved hypothetical protein [uncultured Mycobacterium sp.]